MRIMFGMFPFAFGYLVPENVKWLFFTKFGSACVYASLLDYLDAPILINEHVPFMHMCAVHARHDIIRVHIKCKPCQHDII